MTVSEAAIAAKEGDPSRWRALVSSRLRQCPSTFPTPSE